MTRKSSMISSGTSGFSLVELLVIILVIATLVAIAVPNIPYILGFAGDAKAQRNAQNLVSVFNSAVAAGAYNESGYPEDLEELITSLRVGVSGGESMPDVEFSVQGLAVSDVDDVARYLEYSPDNGRLFLNVE